MTRVSPGLRPTGMVGLGRDGDFAYFSFHDSPPKIQLDAGSEIERKGRISECFAVVLIEQVLKVGLNETHRLA